MTNKKILILGGSGLLGSSLKKTFRNDVVIAPTHRVLNLTNSKKVVAFLAKTKPDSIIYAAGITRIDQAEKNKKTADLLNYVIPKMISNFSSMENIPFFYISTDAVFDGYTDKYKFSEADKPKPKSTYGKSKLRGEIAVIEASKKNCVLRLITLWGKSEKPNFTLMMLERLKSGKESDGIIDQIQNPLLITIACEGIKFAVEHQLSGIYHLGSLDYATNYNLLVKIANKYNLNDKLIKKTTFVKFSHNKKGHRKKKSVLISDKFVKVSEDKILKTIDGSIEIFYKSMKLSEDRAKA